MKTIPNKLKTVVIVIIVCISIHSLLAQVPEKISYQAVVRNANNELIANQQIGVRISILKGSINGAVVYSETHNVVSNSNGLITLEIGSGNTVYDMSSIIWTNNEFFLKTETDPEGGMNYTIVSANQILSVPFALHSKTSEGLTNPITESQIIDLHHFTSADETDPIFNSSVAKEITASDISKWDNKIETEVDPMFNSSVAKSITIADTTNWNNKLNSETDPNFAAWDKSSGISITESQISDLQHFTDADETDPIFNSSVAKEITASDISRWDNKIGTEADPMFNASVAKSITIANTTNWNNKLDSEADPNFAAWNKSTGISITESQISDLDHFTNADETDPVFNSSVAKSITATDTTNWNNKLDSEADPNFAAWNKSTGISITESQISDLDHFTNADETDPVFNSSVAKSITAADTTNWNNKLDSETDPNFAAWNKSTGISITESQISDLDHFTNADETDPVFNSSVAKSITVADTTNWNNKLDSESDPNFAAWNKSTGISITESQISDLNHFTNADETDSVFLKSPAANISTSDITYLNNLEDKLEVGDNILIGNDVNPSSIPHDYSGNAIAIGSYARSYSVETNEAGIAIGPKTAARYSRPGQTIYGESIHTLTSIAIGGEADGDYGGIAIGHQANGQYHNLAIGANASCYSGYNRIAIGNDLVNRYNGTIVLRGTLFLDNCPEQTINGQTGRIFYRNVAPDRETYPDGSTSGWTAKAFTINHPLDPQNKVLRHYCLESPDVWNVYAGNVQVKNGRAEVKFPDYYAALNKVGSEIFSLTAVGGFADCCVLEASDGKHFVIGATKDIQVSWTVKVLRNDEALQKDIKLRPVEQLKSELSKEKIQKENLELNTMQIK